MPSRATKAMAEDSDNKDLPLREDIRLLGRILGDTLRQQKGNAAFATVERIRQSSIRFRRDEDGASIVLGQEVPEGPVEAPGETDSLLLRGDESEGPGDGEHRPRILGQKEASRRLDVLAPEPLRLGVDEIDDVGDLPVHPGPQIVADPGRAQRPPSREGDRV